MKEKYYHEIVFLAAVNVPQLASVGGVIDAPRDEFLHAQARAVHVVAAKCLQLLRRQELVLLVVHIEEMRLAVGSPAPEGVWSNVSYIAARSTTTSAVVCGPLTQRR